MPMRCSRRASSILANSPCARRKSTCAAAASRSACERMARRGAVERAGARSRGHAGFFLGQGARGRVDEPRSAGKDGGERGSRLLVALAQEALAKGRAIRPRAKAARSAHRLRRRCAAAQGGAAGRHCLPHRPRELLLQKTARREVGGDRSGAEGSVAHLQEMKRTYILNSHERGQLVILTYRYRLLPLKSQHRVLERLCEAQRQLYNAALQERIDCYSKTGKTRTYIDQCKALTQCRRELPDMGELPVNLQRWTLKRLDDAFSGFFRRLKARRERTAPASARAVPLQARQQRPQEGARPSSETAQQDRGHAQHLAASAVGSADKARRSDRGRGLESLEHGSSSGLRALDFGRVMVKGRLDA